MPKATINNPSKSVHGQKHGTAGVQSRSLYVDPTKKKKPLRQCGGCATVIGDKNKTGFCRGCLAATRDPNAGHHYLSAYRFGCRCDTCLASREAYRETMRRWRERQAS